jgi:Kef-type K+ transport system membrane component KefB
LKGPRTCLSPKGEFRLVLSVALGIGFFSLFGYTIGKEEFDLLYIGVALALSSTLIVVKLLVDKSETHSTSGRLTIGILMLQDLGAILFMALQPNLQNLHLSTAGRSLLMGLLLLLFAFGTSRTLLARLFRACAKNPEVLLLTSIAWCFVLCGLAEKAGLSKEMGALIAGLSIAAFPYGMDVISKLTGIRDFFVTLFFVSLGLKAPLPSWNLLLFACAAALVVIVTRLTSLALPTYLFRKVLRNGLVTALNLSQVIEFSLVIVALWVRY